MNSDPVICSKGSPPRLTFRERGAILRACSVDLSSHEENFALLPSPQHSRALSEGVKLEKGSHEIKRNEQIFSFQSSFNSALVEGKKAGKARLGGRREILDKLERAILDAENLKQMAFQESINRWKAEEDAMDAKNKAEAAESKYRKEMKRRTEIEEELEKQRREHERFKDEHEEYGRDLLVVQDQCSALKEQIRESEHSAKEFEEKIISAVQLLISFKEKRDQLRIEHDKAIQELEILRRTKQQRTARLSCPQFSTFSLMEIDEATCSFDPSQRIGDGKYGSVYRGIVCHMDVAIRMLPNDGSQGQWRFEREVEVLSRVRHPNILMLIGICTEARSIVYEYLENGSLNDHLVSKGRYPPLTWQTRVRIATELCSALIFLHTNNPPIFHGNLKPTKILLDANLISKIGDLGIFRLIPQNQILPIGRTVYTDPEFLETGVLTLDSDVYSFGVILLLLLTGRPPSGLVKDVRSALRTDKLDMVLDSSAGDWPIHQAKRLAWMALLCCDRKRSNRPELAAEVWSVLEPLRKSCDAHASCLEKKENRQPPSHFICPIYKEVMQDPCTAADGYTYERDAISGWLDSGHKTSPMTNLELASCDLITNHALQYAIQEWLQTA